MNYTVFVFLICLLFQVSCSPNKEVETHEPPMFKSSLPQNEATDVSVETTIEVTFDEVITLAQNHNITLNNQAAQVQTSFTKLTITNELSHETTYTVNIPQGAVVNTFGIASTEAIQLTFTTEKETVVEITPELVTPNASAQAKNVYQFLIDNYGLKQISAVMSNGAMDTNEAEWVNYHTGKYPAMLGIDYIFLNWSPANWIDYNDIDVMKEWWQNNGLITAAWHWNIPPNESITDHTQFTFRTKNDNGVKVTFNPANVPIEGTWENEVATADFDELIGYLKLLQDENIPVLWRPLHEAAGNIYEYNNGTAWFWWGMKGGDAYVALWRYMFTYFQEHGIHNLIWVWTTQTKDDDFYPGDAYVDIIGKDMYNTQDAPALGEIYSSIQEKYPTKIITLSELGNVSPISEQWKAGATWSWFMPWCDHERTNNISEPDFTSPEHEFANAAWWKDAMNRENVLSRDEMPDLK